MKALAALALFLLALHPLSSSAQVAPAYHARAEQLLPLLGKDGGEKDFFSDLFLTAVPVNQWRALTADLRRQYGEPQSLGSVRQNGPTAGQVEVRYRRATVGFTLVIAPEAPNRVIGLQIVGAKQADDSLIKVIDDFEALPGQTAFAIARLTDGGPQWIATRAPDRQMATGSSFKLYVLAELARAVEAGERRWSDVIPLSHKSFSGRLLAYPDRAPMTLHSLATTMIAESDNSAADTLLLALGRENVDATLSRAGHAEADAALPLLTTAEAFALKMPANASLRQSYARASIAQRRAMLRDHAARLDAKAVDIGTVAETPASIDSAEWFASPKDEVALLDWLRRHGGEALPIMAVNPGIAPADAARWKYLGYKGGSEPGVMAMNFLAQAKDGSWYAVTGSWNNPAARLDEPRFVALMTRALNLLAETSR
ncbi:serine hydrolase, partial [Sphingobium cloacae]|uniref:Beta-lactamase class A catalytic domain-containing protein n=1 Tax=Sphingobium cloacae TaxID=120107 RepID=A0A1E1EZ64_9SPHN